MAGASLGNTCPVHQGGKIGQCLLWAVFKSTEIHSPIFVTNIFFHGESHVLISTKMVWATFWPIFLQTLLVTLPFLYLKSVVTERC
jgi:hypothetical protein